MKDHICVKHDQLKEGEVFLRDWCDSYTKQEKEDKGLSGPQDVYTFKIRLGQSVKSLSEKSVTTPIFAKYVDLPEGFKQFVCPKCMGNNF